MPKSVYLLAHPAGHSLSPIMHNAAFAQLDIEAHYSARDIPPEALEATVATLRDSSVLGANVTIPHKVAVIPYLDRLSETAQAIGAVNTIVNRGGLLIGHNTDAKGFTRALTEVGGVRLPGQVVVMLGAGGAARAILYALLQNDVARVYLYNRTPESAVALAQDFAPLGKVEVVPEPDLEAALAQCTLLINTTSVGMAHDGIDPNVSPLPNNLLPERGFVADIIYRPARTRLLRQAEAAGLATQNGLPMLTFQGAESFACWTGRDAPVEVMLRTLEQALYS
jgi:shikimate dehydrogenase